MTQQVTREKEGQAWRIGDNAEIAWIREDTPGGLGITSGIPPVFEAYCTLELPGHRREARAVPDLAERWSRHDRAVLAVLVAHTTHQPWWLAYLDTGASGIVFTDAPKASTLQSWNYVLVEAGPERAAAWRPDPLKWKGSLPDLMYPADRSWLFNTLWDDDWTCIGGTRALIDGFLADPDLGARTRKVSVDDEDATPPGHKAI